MTTDRCCAHCARPLAGQRCDARYCSRNCKTSALRHRQRAELHALRALLLDH
jgi:hypothetical protein